MIKAFLIALCLASSAIAAQWKNSLKPGGETAGPLVLVRDGQPQYTIVVRADGTPQERKAQADLNHWIKEITGADLTRPGGPVIRIVTDETLAGDAYRISVEGADLILAGGPGRGVVNAVYALLEEDLGCRFYTKDSIRLPKANTLAITPVARTYTPKLMLRDPFYFASYDAAWSLRNRTNAPDARVPQDDGGHVDYGGLFVHTAATLLPADKYAHDHPDYFFKNAAGQHSAAQLCPTHPETIKIVTENVLKTLKANPHTEIVSVSKNDNAGDQICMCDRCVKLRADEGGTDMANQLFLVNKVAEAVEKEYPKVWVDTIAYLETIKPPKTIRPRKNVIIRICNDTVGAWSRPFTPARELPVAQIMKDWSAVHDRFSIWDYNINFSHFLAPMPNMDIIADNIRFWTENKAVGVMTQGGYQSTSERDELRAWVIAKLMWDPSRDVNALVEDFTLGHYGKAGPAMMEYEALLAAARKQFPEEFAGPPGGIRYPMTMKFLSPDFISKSTAIFTRAKKAVADDEQLIHRVERAELPILYVRLAQGPVTKDTLTRFEQIARREKVDWLFEWTTRLDAQLDAWRKQLPPDPLVISKGEAASTYQAFPDACRLKNGDIISVFYAGYGHVSLATDDFPKGGRICMVRSSDEGKTWSAPQIVYDGPDDERDSHISQLDDGTLVCTFFAWKVKDGEKIERADQFTWKKFNSIAQLIGAQMVMSSDNGKTWDAKPTPIALDWVCSAPVRQLPDGTCILGVYRSKRVSDKKVALGGSIRSTDRCKTWEPVVEIDPDSGVDLDAETDIIKLKDGRLYAALRSSPADMHFATSPDDGKSWGKVQNIGFRGHCPHLNRLTTGEIILCHRVPQTSIHISRDDTKTWQGPHMIDDVLGAYPATVELKDGTVLIIYYTEGEGSHIRAKRFKVTKDGIEFLPLQ